MTQTRFAIWITRSVAATLRGMTEHHTPEPPAQYSYAVGAGLGLLIGGGVGLFLDEDKFLPLAVIGLAIGLVVAYLVRTIRS